MTAGTYEIRNKLDGMAYGGNSGHIEQRWKEHLYLLRGNRHHCIRLQRAWNKYGEAVFEFVILEEIEDPDERLAAEQVWLDIHHAAGTCYNSAITAGPAGPMSEEHKRNISKGMAGNQNSVGRVVSEETRHKLREANRGRKHTREHRRKNSEVHKGKKLPPFTEEHRRKLSEAGRDRVVSEETRRKLRDAQKGELSHAWGKHPSEETLRKRSESMKRWWAERKAAEAEA